MQGGPGGSSLFGDFTEIGPLDVHVRGCTSSHAHCKMQLFPRPYAWNKELANLLFVDQPVGTGFSYVTPGGFTTSEADIAADFVAFWKQVRSLSDREDAGFDVLGLVCGAVSRV